MIERFEFQVPTETHSNLDPDTMQSLPDKFSGIANPHWAIIKLTGASGGIPQVISHLYSTPERAEEDNRNAAVAAVRVTQSHLSGQAQQDAVNLRLRDRTTIYIKDGQKYTDHTGRIWTHTQGDGQNCTR